MKRKTAAGRIKRILVPTDFSSYSGHAARYACMLARQFGAEITLMHVIESLPYSVSDTFNIIEHRRALQTIAKTLLESQRAEMEEKGRRIRVCLVNGTPYDEILKQAGQRRADLIVMATRGRTGVEHLLLGSVAEKVVRLSPCPVLTVRLVQHRGSIPRRTRRRRS